MKNGPCYLFPKNPIENIMMMIFVTYAIIMKNMNQAKQ